jgi:hypothetical protein
LVGSGTVDTHRKYSNLSALTLMATQSSASFCGGQPRPHKSETNLFVVGAFFRGRWRVRLGGIVNVLDEVALLAVRDARQEVLEVAEARPARAVGVEEADAGLQQLGPFLGFICKVRATGIAVLGL